MPHEAVNFSENEGVRYLHLGTEWIQGAMRLNAPNKIELEYAQQMMAWLLFLEPSSNFSTLQLGLGSGALTKFCLNLNKTIKVTAVDINPAIIVAAHIMFDLPVNNKRLNVIEGDAYEFVMNKSNSHSYDVLQVDLYNGDASGPSLNSLEFYKGCFDTLKSPGVLSVNLFGRHKSFKKNITNLCRAFNNRVIVFSEVHDCNIVALAFKGPPINFSWNLVHQRARFIQDKWGIEAVKWVNNLRHANLNQEIKLSI